MKKKYFVFLKLPSQNKFFHPIEIFFQTFYPMAILFSTFHPKEIFFSDFLSYGNSFFLLFILWQPKIEAQKYEIGTPMKTCP